MKKLVLGSLLLFAMGLQPVVGAEVKTLPPQAYAQMKSGKKIGKIWLSPAWKGAEGFTVGKVMVAGEVESDYANVIDYLPYALRRISTPGSTNVLSLTVVEMSSMDRGPYGSFSATMGVEGRIDDKDGNLLVAFRTREEDTDRETIDKNFEGAMDQIVWSLTKELGKDFARVLEVREQVGEAAKGSGLVPPAPAPQAQLDVKGRLLRLDDLLKKGLITPEEYKTHKEEVLKGL
ncbi:MAG: hypothetical protein P4L36_18620 [Holophaga sp.]|nr:hypothetical protein [Holophaga sp.]